MHFQTFDQLPHVFPGEAFFIRIDFDGTSGRNFFLKNTWFFNKLIFSNIFKAFVVDYNEQKNISEVTLVRNFDILFFA